MNRAKYAVRRALSQSMDDSEREEERSRNRNELHRWYRSWCVDHILPILRANGPMPLSHVALKLGEIEQRANGRKIRATQATITNRIQFATKYFLFLALPDSQSETWLAPFDYDYRRNRNPVLVPMWSVVEEETA